VLQSFLGETTETTLLLLMMMVGAFGMWVEMTVW
jgi:uncharacterized membrane protein YsdA (DUF1294 family)